MKYLKHNVKMILVFVAIDQFIKLWISLKAMGKDIPLFLDLVSFRPIRNTNLSWLGNFFSIIRNPIVLYTVTLVGFLFIILFFQYIYDTYGFYTKLSRVMYSLIIASILCSTRDKIGGGSIDYIKLKGLFTFDLKDCYLTLFELYMVYFIIRNIKVINQIKFLDVIRFYRDKKLKSKL